MNSGIFYLLIVVIMGFVGYRWLVLKKVCHNLPNYLREGAVVLDVRSPEEFSRDHFAKSRNIPLTSLPSKLDGIKKDQLILLCCASGTRSGIAAKILNDNGFTKVINVGSWRNFLTSECQTI